MPNASNTSVSAQLATAPAATAGHETPETGGSPASIPGWTTTVSIMRRAPGWRLNISNMPRFCSSDALMCSPRVSSKTTLALCQIFATRQSMATFCSTTTARSAFAFRGLRCSPDRAIRSFPGFLARSLYGFLAGLPGFRAKLALGADFLQFLIGEVLDSDKRIVGGADANEFVQFDLNGRAIAILRILNQKHHQEGDDGGPGVDDKLPCIRIMK